MAKTYAKQLALLRERLFSMDCGGKTIVSLGKTVVNIARNHPFFDSALIHAKPVFKALCFNEQKLPLFEQIVHENAQLIPLLCTPHTNLWYLWIGMVGFPTPRLWNRGISRQVRILTGAPIYPFRQSRTNVDFADISLIYKALRGGWILGFLDRVSHVRTR